MKITFFGLTLSSSWGNGHATPYRALIKALHARGIAVTFFEKDVPYYARHRDLPQAAFCDLRLFPDWDSVRESALREASESDVVVAASYLPHGSRIADELLNLPRPLHVFYDLDTPITLQNLARHDVEYLRRDQIPEFDLYLSFTGGRILQQLQHWGATNVRPLYGCVDPDLYRPLPPRGDWQCDLSYMGTYAPDRQEKLTTFFIDPATNVPDRRFLLAGSMYPAGLQLPPNVRHLQHVAPCDHPNLYSSSRATLNITRAEMAVWGHCPSGRFFEAAACGTPVLTDEWAGLDEFFHVDRELIVVRRSKDVLQALQLPDAELRAMAAGARERTLDEHTGTCRARQFLEYCDQARTSRTPAMEAAS